MDIQTITKKNTGFGALTPEQRIEMAKLGNAASRKAGNLGFNSDTAKIASAIARSARKAPPPPASGAPAHLG